MVRFSLQLEAHTGLEVKETKPWLSHPSLKCGVCGQSPAAPVSFGFVQLQLSTDHPGRPIRCDDHIEGDTRPWDGILTSDHPCEVPGCPKADTQLVWTPGHAMGHSERHRLPARARWLCAGHESVIRQARGL